MRPSVQFHSLLSNFAMQLSRIPFSPFKKQISLFITICTSSLDESDSHLFLFHEKFRKHKGGTGSEGDFYFFIFSYICVKIGLRVVRRCVKIWIIQQQQLPLNVYSINFVLGYNTLPRFLLIRVYRRLSNMCGY